MDTEFMINERLDTGFWTSGQLEAEYLLDKNQYTDQELRTDEFRVLKKRKRISEEIERLVSKFRHEIEQAARADQLEREAYIRRAQLIKRKYKIKKRTYEKQDTLLGAVLIVSHARDLLNEKADLETVTDSPDLESSPVQTSLVNSIEEHGLDLALIAHIQDALNVYVLDIDETVKNDYEIEHPPPPVDPNWVPPEVTIEIEDDGDVD